MPFLTSCMSSTASGGELVCGRAAVAGLREGWASRQAEPLGTLA